MVQSGGGPRFALKPFQSLAVLGKMFRQELQGDEAAKLGVFGLINHTHPPATQPLEDAVMRNGNDDGCPASARTHLCYRSCNEVSSTEHNIKPRELALAVIAVIALLRSDAHTSAGLERFAKPEGRFTSRIQRRIETGL